MSECKQSVYLAEQSVDMIDAVNKGYEQGRLDQKHEDLDNMVILTEHEIKIIRRGAISEYNKALKENLFFKGDKNGKVYQDIIDEVAEKVDNQNIEEDCEWFKYDSRTAFPKNHELRNPYWEIPKDKMDSDAIRYCPYCGKKIKLV